MAEEADVGLGLWDGQSTGRLVNVARLVAAIEALGGLRRADEDLLHT